MANDSRIDLMRAWERLADKQLKVADSAEDMLEVRNATEVAAVATSKALAMARHINEYPNTIETLKAEWDALDALRGRC